MLQVNHLFFTYEKKKTILNDITFSMEKGERVGLVAPSGYGKTTLAKLLAGYLKMQQGEILFPGKSSLSKDQPYPIQLIPQHPEQAFNPRWKMKMIEKELGKPLDEELLKKLKIKSEWFDRYPHELSGGELQRFSIARILSSQPEYLIADEISTMLDVVTQAQIWHFILEYAKKHSIGLLVMSHNPKLLEVTCTRQIRLDQLNKIDTEKTNI